MIRKYLKPKNHEFKEGVTDDFSPAGLSGLSRRKFLALLGASAALAGTACTDYRDKGEIVPYNINLKKLLLANQIIMLQLVPLVLMHAEY